MKRSPLQRRTPLTAHAPVRNAKRRKPIGACTPEQREAVRDRPCVVCGENGVDPAHLIPRGLCPEGADDVRAVVPLCRTHHRAYDHDRSLSLLEHLEPYFREELAFAVQRFGLLSTLARVTNSHWRETSL